MLNLLRINNRFLLFLFLSVFHLLVLTACGSEESESTTANVSSSEKKDNKKIVIAEPVHNLGYLPLYVAIDQGFFEGIDVSVTTLTGGGAHTNAVLTGQAWGFIGGPEHNAFAKAKGGELRSIIKIHHHIL